MIIFDLDGTLANCEHRRHFVQEPEKYVYETHGNSINRSTTKEWENWKPNWPAFYEACGKDKPIKPVVEMWNNYEVEISVGRDNMMIWSGRCESVRDKTLHWLDENLYGLGLKWWDKVLKMRPIGDNTPDDVLKERWLDEKYEEDRWARKDDIDFVFDDRPKVVRMWRRRGIFVFNCAQTDGEF